MSPKRVLAILGSPHTTGLTATMLNRAIQAAKKAGYAVTVVNLYEKNLAFCRGCRACLTTGVCAQRDDIQELTILLQRCDIVVLAAPVYWANVPAPVKNLFDRLLGVAMEETTTFPRAKLRGKKYLILTACHTPAPFAWIFGQSRGALRAMDEFFKTAGMKPIGKVVYTNTGRRKTVPDRLLRKIEKCWE